MQSQVKLHEVAQNSKAWLALRAPLYTGSGAHKLLRYGAIEYSKAGQGSFKGNFWTKRGHLLEDQAIGLFERIKQVKCLVNADGDRIGFVTNTRYPGCGYSPDGITDLWVVEVKCFDRKKHLAIYNTGVLPLEIMAQIQFGLMICERQVAYLVIYNPDFAKQVIDGERNPDYDPKKAIKIIEIKARPATHVNYRRILKKELAHA